MKLKSLNLLILVSLLAGTTQSVTPQQFVERNGVNLELDGRTHTFIGTNYWYGPLLGLEKDPRRGIRRLRRELDLLKANGVTNLRLMAGAEGSGQINGVTRVGPSLQPTNGRFDAGTLDGLDLLLAEMAKRDMKAVIFLSNNWEWSGGFQQYLDWNRLVPDELNNRKLDWNELRDIIARFYVCYECKQGYRSQMRYVLSRVNKINGRAYTNDPTIMAWELANEPRPMRPGARDRYKEWIRDVAAEIKSIDRNHLVTIGHEGWVGTEGMELFEEVHRDPNIDYLTIHIWAKNWQWYRGFNFAEAFPIATKYIEDHIAVAKRLNKPLVIEEFGLPRDPLEVRNGSTLGRRPTRAIAGSEILSLTPGSPTKLRETYFSQIFSYVGKGPVAGANFWAFGGSGRPVKGQVFWKAGDDYLGDPPMEEQGLNTVFDVDVSTWRVIRQAARSLARSR